MMAQVVMVRCLWRQASIGVVARSRITMGDVAMGIIEACKELPSRGNASLHLGFSR